MSRARLRGAARVAAWAAGGGATVLLLTVIVSLAFGQRVVVVLSGSMEPALAAGDVLIEERLPASEVRVGNVVTFEQPEGGALITHRVRDIERRRGRLVFVTKGDANNTVERWAIAPAGELSRPLRRIPLVGHAVAWAKRPLGFVLLVLAPLLALALAELRGIWRPKEPRELAA